MYQHIFNFSLHSKRKHFRFFGFGAKKDRGRGFSVLAAQEMTQEPKNERGRGGIGRGRKETLAYKPQVSCNVFSCWVQLVSVFFAGC